MKIHIQIPLDSFFPNEPLSIYNPENFFLIID